ncbi:MAG: hypothetical protein HYX75_17610, partial [Acidobacteria bacterium]|nr:hypothetical protein [Acidobacteriota bacterium]
MKLRPSTTSASFFTITSNTATSITTLQADGDLTLTASPGAEYRADHQLFDLTIRGKAKLFTSDKVIVNGTLSVATGSTVHTAELEQ